LTGKNLELIGVKEIAKSIIPYDEETVRRYFRRNVFHAHERSRGVEIKTWRGSAVVRYSVFKKVARQGSKRHPLETVGDIFRKVAGDEDEFIVSRLKNQIPIGQIETDFLNAVKPYFEALR